MAKIVLGMATSHSPMLNTPADQWDMRAKEDKRSSALWFHGRPYKFDDLVQVRRAENLENEITPEKWKERYAANEKAIGRLGEVLKQVSPDVVVIIGDDQQEVLLDDNMPAFMIYYGETVDNVPLTPEQRAKRPAGVAIGDWGNVPPQRTTNPCEPALAEHMIKCLIKEEFDVARSNSLPPGRHGTHGIPHAYGFVYRRIMHDNVTANVPVFINTFYPPNQPSLKRSYNFGKALGQAIASWDSDKTVAVIASGGLSHFVVEEDLDQMVLDALKQGDEKAIISLPEERFESGTSECRNWIATAAVMAGTPLKFDLIDFVPCYRSLAGTGCAMGFARWC